MDKMESSIGEKNAEFWNEICGTSWFPDTQYSDITPSFLKKFDEKYFEFYPYLKSYLPLHEVRGKKVLEVGLGYGTVGEALAASGAEYTGLDIARNPVELMNSRLLTLGKTPSARVGDVLKAPFEDNTFDFVVSIGCLHHTGNTRKAVSEVHRILKPGGRAVIMIYNSYSLRFWKKSPIKTLGRIVSEKLLHSKSGFNGNEQDRKLFDADRAERAAPQTEFFSAGQIQNLFSQYSSVDVHRENMDDLGFMALTKWMPNLYIPREQLMGLSSSLGLDLYVRAVK